MELLYTKRSKLIYWALREPVTHVSVKHGNYVFHSSGTRKGVNIESYSTFMENNSIVFRQSVGVPFRQLMNKYIDHQDDRYDYIGAGYLGLRAILRRLGVKLPKKNLWNFTGMLFCSEWVGEVLGIDTNSNLTPYQLYKVIEHERHNPLQ